VEAVLHVFDGQLDNGVKCSPKTSFKNVLIWFFYLSGAKISPGKWLYHRHHKWNMPLAKVVSHH